MKLIKNKETFLKALTAKASLYFSYHDTNDIVENYNEWFENEKAIGKSDTEICNTLSISSIIKENIASNTIDKLALFKNPLTILVVLLFIQYTFDYGLYYKCDLENWDFGIIAFIFNIIFPIVGNVLLKQYNIQIAEFKFILNKKICLLFMAYSLLLIFTPTVYMLRPDKSLPGEYYQMFYFMGIFILLLFSVYLIWLNIFFIPRIFPVIAVIHAIITLLLYYITQLHALYDEKADYIFFGIISCVIILEIIVFSILAYKKAVR